MLVLLLVIIIKYILCSILCCKVSYQFIYFCSPFLLPGEPGGAGVCGWGVWAGVHPLTL